MESTEEKQRKVISSKLLIVKASTGLLFLLLAVLMVLYIVHWLDSLHGVPSAHHEKIIAELLQCANDDIQIVVVNVDMQEGNFDCGLFALANIMAVLNGVDVSMIKFDQKQMRQHLVSCLKVKLFKPRSLPSVKWKTKKGVKRFLKVTSCLSIACAVFQMIGV